MNEENHIIQFEHTFGLYKRLISNNDIYIDEYKKFGFRIDIGYRIIIYYNNLYIYKFPFSRYNYNYIFNLSNMLYKLHNSNYYRRYNHKELI